MNKEANTDMEIKTGLCSRMETVFPDDTVFPPAPGTLELLHGERGGAQLYLRADADAEVQISVTGAPAALYEIRTVPVGLGIPENAVHCTVLRGGKSGDYPDPLFPCGGTVTLAAGKTTAIYLWIETRELPPGERTLTVEIRTPEGTATHSLRLNVSRTELPEQELIHTDWFHTDCLSTYYGVPVRSEEWWRIVGNFMKNAAENGVTCLLTPLFTPPLDTEVGGERPTVQLVGVTRDGGGYRFDLTDLRRFVRLAREAGIGYFEFSHFFTQWGAKHAPKVIARTENGEERIFGWETDALSPDYVAFLRQLAPELKAFTDAEGITERCFVHVSDEPGRDDLEQYRKCAAVIREAFGCYRHIDALSDLDFYSEGMVETPVPNEGEIGTFYGKAHPLWTYYCCGQLCEELPNRFIVMPAARVRILGALLYKYDCEGFLHWGYNFYYTSLSRRPVDPFKETDSGGAFPAGDAFVVYPGPGGEPLSSLRQQSFYAGLQDLRALKAAEKKRSRAEALKVLEETMGDIRFTDYPMAPAAFGAMRAALNRLLDEN